MGDSNYSPLNNKAASAPNTTKPSRQSLSILKPLKARCPLQDLDLVPNTEEDTTTTTTTFSSMRRRRVSFAGVNKVKEFHTAAESLTVHHTPAYDEPFTTTMSSDSSGHHHLTDSKLSLSEGASLHHLSNAGCIESTGLDAVLDLTMKSFDNSSYKAQDNIDFESKENLGKDFYEPKGDTYYEADMEYTNVLGTGLYNDSGNAKSASFVDRSMEFTSVVPGYFVNDASGAESVQSNKSMMEFTDVIHGPYVAYGSEQKSFDSTELTQAGQLESLLHHDILDPPLSFGCIIRNEPQTEPEQHMNIFIGQNPNHSKCELSINASNPSEQKIESFTMDGSITNNSNLNDSNDMSIGMTGVLSQPLIECIKTIGNLEGEVLAIENRGLDEFEKSNFDAPGFESSNHESEMEITDVAAFHPSSVCNPDIASKSVVEDLAAEKLKLKQQDVLSFLRSYSGVEKAQVLTNIDSSLERAEAIKKSLVRQTMNVSVNSVNQFSISHVNEISMSMSRNSSMELTKAVTNNTNYHSQNNFSLSEGTVKPHHNELSCSTNGSMELTKAVSNNSKYDSNDTTKPFSKEMSLSNGSMDFTRAVSSHMKCDSGSHLFSCADPSSARATVDNSSAAFGDANDFLVDSPTTNRCRIDEGKRFNVNSSEQHNDQTDDEKNNLEIPSLEKHTAASDTVDFNATNVITSTQELKSSENDFGPRNVRKSISVEAFLDNPAVSSEAFETIDFNGPNIITSTQKSTSGLDADLKNSRKSISVDAFLNLDNPVERKIVINKDTIFESQDVSMELTKVSKESSDSNSCNLDPKSVGLQLRTSTNGGLDTNCEEQNLSITECVAPADLSSLNSELSKGEYSKSEGINSQKIAGSQPMEFTNIHAAVKTSDDHNMCFEQNSSYAANQKNRRRNRRSELFIPMGKTFDSSALSFPENIAEEPQSISDARLESEKDTSVDKNSSGKDIGSNFNVTGSANLSVITDSKKSTFSDDQVDCIAMDIKCKVNLNENSPSNKFSEKVSFLCKDDLSLSNLSENQKCKEIVRCESLATPKPRDLFPGGPSKSNPPKPEVSFDCAYKIDDSQIFTKSMMESNSLNESSVSHAKSHQSVACTDRLESLQSSKTPNVLLASMIKSFHNEESNLDENYVNCELSAKLNQSKGKVMFSSQLNFQQISEANDNFNDESFNTFGLVMKTPGEMTKNSTLIKPMMSNIFDDSEFTLPRENIPRSVFLSDDIECHTFNHKTETFTPKVNSVTFDTNQEEVGENLSSGAVLTNSVFGNQTNIISTETLTPLENVNESLQSCNSGEKSNLDNLEFQSNVNVEKYDVIGKDCCIPETENIGIIESISPKFESKCTDQEKYDTDNFDTEAGTLPEAEITVNEVLLRNITIHRSKLKKSARKSRCFADLDNSISRQHDEVVKKVRISQNICEITGITKLADFTADSAEVSAHNEKTVENFGFESKMDVSMTDVENLGLDNKYQANSSNQLDRSSDEVSKDLAASAKLNSTEDPLIPPVPDIMITKSSLNHQKETSEVNTTNEDVMNCEFKNCVEDSAAEFCKEMSNAVAMTPNQTRGDNRETAVNSVSTLSPIGTENNKKCFFNSSGPKKRGFVKQAAELYESFVSIPSPVAKQLKVSTGACNEQKQILDEEFSGREKILNEYLERVTPFANVTQMQDVESETQEEPNKSLKYTTITPDTFEKSGYNMCSPTNSSLLATDGSDVSPIFKTPSSVATKFGSTVSKQRGMLRTLITSSKSKQKLPFESTPKRNFRQEEKEDQSNEIEVKPANESIIAETMIGSKKVTFEFWERYNNETRGTKSEWTLIEAESSLWSFGFLNSTLRLNIHFQQASSCGLVPVKNITFSYLDSSKAYPELAIGQNILLQRYPNSRLKSSCRNSSNVFDLLHMISNDGIQVKKIISSLKRLWVAKFNKYTVSFEVMRVEPNYLAEIFVDLSSWESLSPSSITIVNTLGTLRLNKIRYLFEETKKNEDCVRVFWEKCREFVKNISDTSE